MTRMIDADALNKKLCETTIFIKGGEMFQRMINDVPTIEPDSDTISRSQAIKDISEWATDILHPDRLIKEDAIHILESLPSAEQVTGKLNNPDNSLLTADSEACKEQKSKLDLISRQDALAEFRDGRDVYDIMESIEELPSVQGGDAEMNEVKSPFMQQSPDDGADTISRQAVKEQACMFFGHEVIFANKIDLIPSAPDSRQRGEWVPNHIPDSMLCECDQCGFDLGAYTFNFCPNCGADMRGEEE